MLFFFWLALTRQLDKDLSRFLWNYKSQNQKYAPSPCSYPWALLNKPKGCSYFFVPRPSKLDKPVLCTHDIKSIKCLSDPVWFTSELRRRSCFSLSQKCDILTQFLWWVVKIKKNYWINHENKIILLCFFSCQGH